MIKHPLIYKIRKAVAVALTQTFLLIVALACLFPLAWMLSSALKTRQTVTLDMGLIPKNPQWGNFYTAWTKANFGTYFFNSIFYTAVVVISIVLISSLAAYAFARLNFPGRNILFFIFLATMMIPIPGAFIALYVLIIKLGTVPIIGKYITINTRLGYMLPQINAGLAMGIFLIKTFFDKLPKDLEDSARIDGCSKLGIYRHIALPLAKPAIAVVVIFNCLAVWNEFLLANLLLSDKELMPLQRGLMTFWGEHLAEYHLLMAGIAITVVPIILMYLIMQKYIISGITAGALKG
ncbi:MAG: carbohydrate ABC transporter permease [Candidatus Omnitrophota bacterium]